MQRTPHREQQRRQERISKIVRRCLIALVLCMPGLLYGAHWLSRVRARAWHESLPRTLAFDAPPMTDCFIDSSRPADCPPLPPADEKLPFSYHLDLVGHALLDKSLPLTQRLRFGIEFSLAYRFGYRDPLWTAMLGLVAKCSQHLSENDIEELLEHLESEREKPPRWSQETEQVLFHSFLFSASSLPSPPVQCQRRRSEERDALHEIAFHVARSLESAPPHAFWGSTIGGAIAPARCIAIEYRDMVDWMAEQAHVASLQLEWMLRVTQSINRNGCDAFPVHLTGHTSAQLYEVDASHTEDGVLLTWIEGPENPGEFPVIRRCAREQLPTDSVSPVENDNEPTGGRTALRSSGR